MRLRYVSCLLCLVSLLMLLAGGSASAQVSIATSSASGGWTNSGLRNAVWRSQDSKWYVVLNDGSSWKYFTSPTGATWTAGGTITGLTAAVGAVVSGGLQIDSNGNIYALCEQVGHSYVTAWNGTQWLATPFDLFANGSYGAVPSIYESGGTVYMRGVYGEAQAGAADLFRVNNPLSSTTVAHDYYLNNSNGTAGLSANANAVETVGTNVVFLNNGKNAAGTQELSATIVGGTAGTGANSNLHYTDVVADTNMGTSYATCVDGSGNLHVVYNITSGGATTAGWYEVVYNGSTWSSVSQITTLTTNDLSPSMMKDSGGTVRLFYAKYNAASDYGIGMLTRSAGSTAGGWAAGTDALVHSGVNRQVVAVSKMDDGNHAMLTWMQGTNPYAAYSLSYTTVVATSFTAAPSTIPASHVGNITLTLTGSGTSWVPGNTTSFTITNSVSGTTTATKVSQNITSATAATFVLSVGAGAGTFTITDAASATTATVTVGNPTVSVSPNSSGLSASTGITLTGVNTVWTLDNPTFSIAGAATGTTLTGITILSNTSATATVNTSTTSGAETITDPSTGQTAAFTVNNVTTTTYLAKNAALLYTGGLWVDAEYNAHFCRMPMGIGSQINFRATGTQLTASLYMPAGVTVQTSVDGGTWTTLAGNTSAWTTFTIFTGLTDTQHDVGIRLASGTTYLFAIDQASTFVVTGAAPALAVPDSTKFTKQYFTTGNVLNGFAGQMEGRWTTQADFTNGYGRIYTTVSASSIGSAIRFKSQGASIKVFGALGNLASLRILLTTDGVDGGALITPTVDAGVASSGYGWMTIATGLDTVASHEYILTAVNGVTNVWTTVAIMCPGGPSGDGFVNAALTARPILVCYGDSITYGSLSSVQTKCYAYLLAHNKNAALWDFGNVGYQVMSDTSTFNALSTSYNGFMGINAQVVCYLGGINDQNSNGGTVGVNDFIEADRRVVEYLSNAMPNAKIYWLGITPNYGSNSTTWRTSANAGKSASATAFANAKIVYVSTDTFLIGTNVGGDMGDSLHPNDTGHATLATGLEGAITITANSATTGGRRRIQ